LVRLSFGDGRSSCFLAASGTQCHVMRDPRTDQIAREAARLIGTGRTDDIAEAIRIAAGTMGFVDAPLPSAMRVRRHVQAMTMQAVGQAAYEQCRLNVWSIAEEIMSAFEHAMPDDRTVLVGRAAEGHIDAGVTIHIRLYTHAPVSEIAQSLVDFGYDEPSFATIETRHGRLSQLRLIEDGIEVAITRCQPALIADSTNDLFSGKRIEAVELSALRRRIAEAQAPADSSE
jgi:hypothetical protein